MDLLSELPPEVSDYILGHLSARDLCQCLAVSKGWRHLANVPRLWAPFCRRKQLSLRSQTSTGGLELCSWAYTYTAHMREVTRNWRERSYKSHKLAKEDWCCCIACSRSMMVVYYPRVSIVRLYQVSSDSVDLIASILPALPNAIAIPDVFIDEDYIVLSRGNAALLYHSTSYTLHKFIVKDEQGLSITNSSRPFAETDRRLYVKIIRKRVLWLESDSVYIVDMERNEYKVMSDTFRCLSVHGEYVYAANDVIAIYTLSGEKISCLNINSVLDLWVGDDVVVCLTGRKDQNLQVWRVSSNSKLSVLSVEKDPCVCIGPSSEDMFLLEFSDGFLKLRHISFNDSSSSWIYKTKFQRELTIHPEIRLLCERFLFVRPSLSKDENFLLVESRSGTVAYDSVMPPSLHPPSYIYHLSDQIFITAESRLIHVRCYA